jgi:hypothetical protein
MHRFERHAPAIVLGLLLATGCASQSHQQSDLSLDVEDNGVRIAVSTLAARGVIEEVLGSDVQCDGDLDGPVRLLLEELEREGPRGRAAARVDDGIVEGRRRGGTLDLRFRGHGSGRIEVEMPWQLARCLLGHATTVDGALTSSIRVAAIDGHGKRYSFTLQ